MQRGGGAAIRHPYLRFMCTRCGGYHAVVLVTCNWQQGAPQQGQPEEGQSGQEGPDFSSQQQQGQQQQSSAQGQGDRKSVV